jgi:hypothetical protein
MRTGQPIISRPAWYDRNPSSKVYGFFLTDQAPHSEATRISYTASSNKKAMIELLHIRIIRKTAASTAGRPRAWITITPSGQTGTTIINTHLVTNTVGDVAEVNLGTSLTLLPGDAINIKTVDDSTGGALDYTGGMKITEFDA